MTAVDTWPVYAAAAPIYRDAGWAGVLPLPVGKKANPPNGYTGHHGDPDAQQVAQWCRLRADSNVGLRMLDVTVGIDVDHYDKVKDDGTVVQKRGADELVAIAEELGVPLPPTWVSSARDEPESGVRLFRVPAGCKFVGELSDAIEILQRGHRYAVVWPSTNPEAGDAVYRWRDPSGREANRPPTPDELPELPPEWVERLKDHSEPEVPRAPVPPRPVPPGAPDRSPAVQKVLDGRRAWTQGSRHPQARRLSMALARLEDLGHPGVQDALDLIGGEYVAAVAGERGRKPEKEWDDLVEGARKRAASTAAKTPEYAEILAEKRKCSSWHELVATTEQLPPDSATAPESDAPLADFDGMAIRWAAEAQMLPDRFWDARADLSHIRQAAHSKGCSADLVLHATLARLSAYTSHTIVLPDIIGVPGSLNYFVLAIAPSGLGKSMASSLSGRLLARPDGIHEKPLGSGEGIAENYWGNVTELDEKGKKRTERRQVRHNCFLVADEGEAMAALMDRSGSVLASELRSAWVGQTIGQSNATTERSRIVQQHTYRLGLLMGFQPEKAAQLLADNIGGTPQRFVWTAAVDPNQPIEAPAWPGPFELPRVPNAVLRSHESRGFGGLVKQMMTVDDAITDEVWTEHIRKVRGESVVASLDSHQHLHLLKIGGLLALLEGRLHVTLEDWELARIAWQTSCRVRANVEAAVRAQEERSEASRVARHAAREHAAEAARGSARGNVERLAKRIGRWVHEQQSAGKTPDDGHPHRDLHHRLKSSERALLDPAISHAIEAGWLVDEDGRYRAGESMPA